MSFRSIKVERLEQNLKTISDLLSRERDLSLYGYTGGMNQFSANKIKKCFDIDVILFKRVDPLLSRIILFFVSAKIFLFKINNPSQLINLYEDLLGDGLSSVYVVEKREENKFLAECNEKDAFFYNHFSSIRESSRGIILTFELNSGGESEDAVQDLFIGAEVDKICRLYKY